MKWTRCGWNNLTYAAVWALLCGGVAHAATGFSHPVDGFNPPRPRALGGFGGPWGTDEHGRPMTHNGVDVVEMEDVQEARERKVPVRPIAEGRVIHAGGFGPGWGDAVILAHDSPDGPFVAVYGHIIIDDRIRRIEGLERDLGNRQTVTPSDVLGYIDPHEKNVKSDPHLHFGLFRGAVTSFPIRYWGGMLSTDFPGPWVDPGEYLTAAPRDSVLLVLDTSGSTADSMPNGGRKVDAIKVAVRGFLKTVDDDVRFNSASYRIAAITFSDAPGKLCDFTSETDYVRNAIADLQPQQSTNFGDSLEMAISMLEQASGDEKTIVFFSDGKTNTGSIPRDDFLIDFDPTTSPRSDIFRDEKARDLYWRANQAKIRIITVGFGDPAKSSSLQKYIWLPGVEPDLDDEVLRKLALTPKTGGDYVNAQDYTGLLKSFAKAYNIGSGRHLVYETTGTIGQGETQQVLFDPSVKPTQTAGGRWSRQIASFDLLCTPAEADGAGQLLVTLGWDVGKLVLSLKDPTGTDVTSAYPGAHISMDESPINVFIDDPKRGKWSATILAEDAAGGTVSYYLLASSQLPPIPVGGGGAGSGTDWENVALGVLLSFILVLVVAIAVIAVRRRATAAPHGPPGRLTLRVQSRGEPPRNFAVAAAVVRIGRGPGNDIVLADPKASGSHAELRLGAGRVVVVDAGSRNGTWVGGERVASRVVRPGETIRIGDTTVMLLRQ